MSYLLQGFRSFGEDLGIIEVVVKKGVELEASQFPLQRIILFNSSNSRMGQQLFPGKCYIPDCPLVLFLPLLRKGQEL